MPGIITGILNNATIASELGQKLQNYGTVSVIANKTPADNGPLKAVPIADIPRTLMSYGEDINATKNAYAEIEEGYSFVAVQIPDNEIETTKKLLSDWGAKDIQYFYK